MKLEDIKNLVINGSKKNDTIPLLDISEIQQHTKVLLEMDRDGDTYFYKVNIADLVSKDIRPEILSDNGWALSSDEEYIILNF